MEVCFLAALRLPVIPSGSLFLRRISYSRRVLHHVSHRRVFLASLSARTSASSSARSSAALPVTHLPQTSSEVREAFLSFYENKLRHKRAPSASLVPDDPSIMLTIAGMVPFKPVFMGLEKPQQRRMCSSQVCVRTNDIENVGRTARHQTMFEMLGAFSFGDYFKREAIVWAWELLTEVYGVDKERLAVSVYEKDDEAYNIWRDVVGLREERIARMGEKDNFWAAGETGPCGPCSEIYFYLGNFSEGGNGRLDLEEDDKWLELYNLVFMQYNRTEGGQLSPLESKNIDTGMGLERMCSVLQNKKSSFETDLMMPIIGELGKLAGKKFEVASPKEQLAMKIVADHLRAISHLCADGVRASNVGRGYILRRLIRRASRQGRVLGLESVFLANLLPVVSSLAAEAGYLNIEKNFELVRSEISREESKFLQTLEKGEMELMELIRECKENAEDKVLTGQDCFDMYDRYGLPVELTTEIAEENGVRIDLDGFDEAMERQRQRARDARMVTENGNMIEAISQETLSDLTTTSGSTRFSETSSASFSENVGSSLGIVTGLVVDGILSKRAREGDDVVVVLDVSPFYAEGGGQVGDSGVLSLTDGSVVVIQDTKMENGVYMHIGKVTAGEIRVGDEVIASIDMRRRRRIAAHHTATHLLQAALKSVISEENIAQAGSLVDGERLRFDFTCSRPVTSDELDKIEERINGWIADARSTNISIMEINSAKEKGAIAMFGEKYGEKVRVVDVPSVSMELCGGTHVENTAEISLFKITSEAGIASGVRRIEAVCGSAALPYLMTRDRVVRNAATVLNVAPEQIPERVVSLQNEIKAKNKTLSALETELAVEKTKNLIRGMTSVGNKGAKYIVEDVGEMSADALRAAAEKLGKEVGQNGLVVLVAKNGPKAAIIAVVGKELQATLPAGKLVGRIGKKCGGGGGGRAAVAQAGGKAELISNAVEEARLLVRLALQE